MTACQVKLKNYAQAKILVGICKHYLTKYVVPESEGFLEKLNKHLKQIEADGPVANVTQLNTKNGKPSKNEADIPSRHETFPGASAKLEVGYSPDKGRFAYAGNEILAGETVLREEPFAKTLLVERMGTHCLHCFKPLRAAVACEVCANVAYCSRACRQSADQYHQHECRVFSLLIGSGMSVLPHLALRMITQTTAEELLSVRIKNLQTSLDIL